MADRFHKATQQRFTKFVDERMQAFGWASVISKAGETLFDEEGDGFLAEDMEPAVYKYVKQSRAGSESHGKIVSELIESIFFDKAKQDALGIDLGQEGWWVGYQFYDVDTWSKVRSGELGMFSIAGEGRIEELV